MKERPILFNTEMIKAILEGRKTQTRRFLKPFQVPKLTEYGGEKWWCSIIQNHPRWGFGAVGDTEEECMDEFRKYMSSACQFGEVGDRLWVRETFRYFNSADECGCSDFPCPCPPNGTPLYKATHATGCDEKWKPSIHMPRSACRIVLEITKIRVERLASISAEDALAEGITHRTMNCPRHEFFQLWNSIYGDMAHELNPWVWVVEFKVVKGGVE